VTTPAGTIWNIPRRETADTPAADADGVMVIPAAGGAAPRFRSIEHFADDLGVPDFTPGYIERATGVTLPAENVNVAWSSGTVPPVTLLGPLSFVKSIARPMVVGLEVRATSGGGGLRPDLIADLRDPGGNVISTRVTLETDGDVYYHQLILTNDTPVPTASLVVEGVDGSDSGDFFVDVRDVLGFTGTGAGARLVAQIADRLLNITEDDDMGITQAQAIELINQLIPAAQRPPNPSGHGDQVLRANAGGGALVFDGPGHVVRDGVVAGDHIRVTLNDAGRLVVEATGVPDAPDYSQANVFGAVAAIVDAGHGLDAAVDGEARTVTIALDPGDVLHQQAILGAGGVVLIGDPADNAPGGLMSYHSTDVLQSRFVGHRTVDRVRGVASIVKSVTGVSWPEHYYFRREGAGIVPTTDGADTAETDLREYMGSSRRLFYTDDDLIRDNDDSSRSANLTRPITNAADLNTTHGGEDLTLILADVEPDDFIAAMRVASNDGASAPVFDGYTAMRLHRIATGSDRWRMTPTGPNGDASRPIRVNDLFNVAEHAIALNAGPRTNQVAVNGTTQFDAPYLADSHQDIELTIDVPRS